MSFTVGAAMLRCLELAATSSQQGDHPYGAVLISAMGETVEERNRVVTTSDPTAHAETMAIRVAAKQWGLDLAGAILVASYEPCPMCCGAILEAGIVTIVIGQRRTIGEPPLGRYRVEELLELIDRPQALEVIDNVRTAEVAAFYASLIPIVEVK